MLSKKAGGKGMSSIQVTLKDGKQLEFNQGTSLREIAEHISRSLAKIALVAKVNGQIVDLNSNLNKDAAVEFLTF